MATYRLDIAYEGTRFSGWARQGESELRTVQGEVEAALAQLFGMRVPTIVAGRTDAGVHALAQVASFELPELPAGKAPPPDLRRALHAITPRDIEVRGTTRTVDGFNSRRDALSRRYRYRIETGPSASPFERRYALHFPYPLDRARLAAAASEVVGRHDFTAFTPTATEHVHFRRRILEASWRERAGGLLELEIEADAFMRSMVRIIVGTMLEIGTGRRPPESMGELLGGRPRPEAGETAPAHGLFLIAVRY